MRKIYLFIYFSYIAVAYVDDDLEWIRQLVDKDNGEQVRKILFIYSFFFIAVACVDNDLEWIRQLIDKDWQGWTNENRLLWRWIKISNVR